MLVCPECRWQNPKGAVFCVDCGQGLKRAAAEGKAPAQSVSVAPQPLPSLRAPQGPSPAIAGATILDLQIDQKILREFARLRAESVGGASTLDETPSFMEPPLEGAPTLDELPALRTPVITPSPDDLADASPEALSAEDTVGEIPSAAVHQSGPLLPLGEAGLLGPPLVNTTPTPEASPVKIGSTPPPFLGPPPFAGPPIYGDDDDDDDDFEDVSVDFSLNGDDLEEVGEFRSHRPPPLPQISYILRPISSHLHALLSVEDKLTLGRADTQGHAAPEGDPLIEPEHARVEVTEGGLNITDLETDGGVWVRLRPERLVRPNSLIRVGAQVLRLERCAPPPEQTPSLPIGVASEDDRFRLVQLDRYHRPRDTHHLSKEGGRVGRRMGEMVFSDDALMSPVHAAFIPQDEGVLVRDLESQNGTWVQLTQTTTLELGDVFLLGRSAWRVGQAD